MKQKLVHCSYHKCLTVYYAAVLSRLYNRILRLSRGYRHFNSLIEDFYQESDNYKIASVNNHALDWEWLGSDYRITRFIRDPRDMVVSGYFYHQRGAEDWCNIVNPRDEDWKVVNGCVPENMGEGHSLSTYLQSLSKEEGLLAEIEFRRNHFNSMKLWPMEDPRIKIFRYEDLVGNELEIFAELFSFYGMSWPERRIGLFLADRFSAKKRKGRSQHIRNSKSGQWEEHFTPRVRDYFEQQHGELPGRYGYG